MTDYALTLAGMNTLIRRLCKAASASLSQCWSATGAVLESARFHAPRALTGASLSQNQLFFTINYHRPEQQPFTCFTEVLRTCVQALVVDGLHLQTLLGHAWSLRTVSAMYRDSGEAQE